MVKCKGSPIELAKKQRASKETLTAMGEEVTYKEGLSITERAQYKQLGDVYDQVHNDYKQEK